MSSVFDPLAFLAHFVIRGRLILKLQQRSKWQLLGIWAQRGRAVWSTTVVSSEDSAQERDVSFIIGKAKVAPVKHHTIPKLKPMYALKGHRLNKVFMWSDSTTVIQWIRSSNIFCQQESGITYKDRESKQPRHSWNKFWRTKQQWLDRRTGLVKETT